MELALREQYIDPSQESKGVCAVLKEEESFEVLLKRFKKKVQKSGIEREFLLRSAYEKPSERKKRKRAENQARLRREQMKLEKYLKKKYGPGYDPAADKKPRR
jgi:small subunit ribosomal protein S21